MPRTALALQLVLATIAGCDRDKGPSSAGPTDGPDVMSQKPTEEEVRHRVWQVFSNKNVALLSPLMEVPDQYFTRTNQPVAPAAVAAYVGIRGGPPAQPNQPAGKTTVLLVVVGAPDPNAPHPGDRGKHKWYQPVEPYAVGDTFGADWLAKHPVPKDPSAKGPPKNSDDD